jgi:hypothetical protein
MQRFLSQWISYVKQVYEREMWNDLPKAYKYIEKYRNLDPQRSELIQKVNLWGQKLVEQEKKIREFKSRQERESALGASYMGSWYASLAKKVKELEELCQKKFSVTSTGASVRLQRIEVHLKKMAKEYPKDIAQSVQTIEETMASKDIQKWIQWRKDTAQSTSQSSQAQIVEDFFKKGKKLNILMESELSTLSQGVSRFKRDVNRGEVTEGPVKDLLRVLDAIDRKYKESQKDFNSAALNFQSWK